MNAILSLSSSHVCCDGEKVRLALDPDVLCFILTCVDLMKSVTTAADVN